MAKENQKDITLALDLSTTSTGFAVFEGKKLIDHGVIKPSYKGLYKLKYPEGAYRRIVSISEQVCTLIMGMNPDHIVIEEVNRGINRIAQKSLDALHFFVIDRIMSIDEEFMNKSSYMDSNGAKGWRGKLGIRLSKEDKEANKKARAYNKRHKKDIKAGVKEEKPIVDWKVLAQRYVNKKFKTKYNVIKVKSHADVVDAIALGWAYLS